jgi:hypothetical protein
MPHIPLEYLKENNKDGYFPNQFDFQNILQNKNESRNKIFKKNVERYIKFLNQNNIEALSEKQKIFLGLENINTRILQVINKDCLILYDAKKRHHTTFLDSESRSYLFSFLKIIFNIFYKILESSFIFYSFVMIITIILEIKYCR